MRDALTEPRAPRPLTTFTRTPTARSLLSRRSEFLLDLGRIFYYMTEMPRGAAEPSSLGVGPGRAMRIADTIRALRDLQDLKRDVLACDAFVPAFTSLMLPALDARRDKSDKDMNKLYIALKLFMNLLRVPDSLAALAVGGAQSAASTVASNAAGLSDRFLLRLREHAFFDTALSLARVTERTEFKRRLPFAAVQLEFWFNVFEDQKGSALGKEAAIAADPAASARNAARVDAVVSAETRRREAAQVKSQPAEGGGVGGVHGGASLSGGGGGGGRGGGGDAATNCAKPSLAASLPARYDPLRSALHAERSVLASSRAASDSQRHSRFGTNIKVTRLGEFGVVSSVNAALSLKTFQETAPPPMRRAASKLKKNDLVRWRESGRALSPPAHTHTHPSTRAQ